MTFTHLDDDQRPTMVDVSEKPMTKRTAIAQARVLFPAAVAKALRDRGFKSAKGPIFDTAIVAGVMGAKRTHELIPFCHPLGLENCRVTITMDGDSAFIRCAVSVHHKTGVEMEALTGASIAALTIYDMCKALSHDIVITDTRLVAKHGGRTSYSLKEAMSPPIPEVYGLILAGGASARMRRDKAALPYQGQSQLDRAFELANRHVTNVFVSIRRNQAEEPTRARRPMIIDAAQGEEVAPEGPIVGIRSALAAHPDVAWLVVACDLPFLSDAALAQLLAERDPASIATAFRSTHDGLPEPLCAIWEPAAAAALSAYVGGGGRCPRKFLINHPVCLLDPEDPRALDNINTPEEYTAAQDALAARRESKPCN